VKRATPDSSQEFGAQSKSLLPQVVIGGALLLVLTGEQTTSTTLRVVTQKRHIDLEKLL